MQWNTFSSSLTRPVVLQDDCWDSLCSIATSTQNTLTMSGWSCYPSLWSDWSHQSKEILIFFLCLALGGNVGDWCVRPWKTQAGVMDLQSTANSKESSSAATQSLTRGSLPKTLRTAPSDSRFQPESCWTQTSACTSQTFTACTRHIITWCWCLRLLAQRETTSVAPACRGWTWPPTPFWPTLPPRGRGRSLCTATPVTWSWRCFSRSRFTWIRAVWSRSVGTTSLWVWPQQMPRKIQAAKCATSAWGAEGTPDKLILSRQFEKTQNWTKQLRKLWTSQSMVEKYISWTVKAASHPTSTLKWRSFYIDPLDNMYYRALYLLSRCLHVFSCIHNVSVSSFLPPWIWCYCLSEKWVSEKEHCTDFFVDFSGFPLCQDFCHL